jgi:hypothetical protein
VQSQEDCIMERRRIKHEACFEERLAEQAQRLREQAKTLPPGKERDGLLRRARRAEISSHINEWLTSPGLASPK